MHDTGRDQKHFSLCKADVLIFDMDAQRPLDNVDEFNMCMCMEGTAHTVFKRNQKSVSVRCRDRGIEKRLLRPRTGVPAGQGDQVVGQAARRILEMVSRI